MTLHIQTIAETLYQCYVLFMVKEEIIFAFIDSQNLNLGVLSSGWKLDFSKFRIYLKEKYKVKKAYLFIGQVAGNEKLYTYLQESGYILIFKPTLEFKRNKERITKGNVDAELVLHAMIEYPRYDKAMIVSGDGDFHCLIEYLVEKGKLFKIVAPNKRYSSLLRRFTKYILVIAPLKEKLKILPKK